MMNSFKNPANGMKTNGFVFFQRIRGDHQSALEKLTQEDANGIWKIIYPHTIKGRLEKQKQLDESKKSNQTDHKSNQHN